MESASVEVDANAQSLDSDLPLVAPRARDRLPSTWLLYGAPFDEWIAAAPLDPSWAEDQPAPRHGSPLATFYDVAYGGGHLVATAHDILGLFVLDTETLEPVAFAPIEVEAGDRLVEVSNAAGVASNEGYAFVGLYSEGKIVAVDLDTLSTTAEIPVRLHRAIQRSGRGSGDRRPCRRPDARAGGASPAGASVEVGRLA
jgi:hypothetical protein